MKRCMQVVALSFALFASGAFAQDADESSPRPRAERPRAEMAEARKTKMEMELRHEQLNIAEREAGLQFQREKQKIELEKARRGIDRDFGGRHGGGRAHCMGHAVVFVALCAVVHVLLTVWVFQDIRKRNAGSGIWIVITLLTGFFGALLYALVRLGDIRSNPAT